MADIQDLLHRLDQTIQGFEKLPAETRDDVFAAFELVDEVHRIALRRLAARLEEAGIWEAVLEDENVHTLFMLYDLVTLDEATQVALARSVVQPLIDSQDGEVEVLRVEDGTVHLRLLVARGASRASLEPGIEAALREAFPGFRSVVLHEPDPRGMLRPFPA
jgi:Fe-S cluster biogenesis protein NfuA